MAISFNHIPSAIRVPLTYIEFDNSKAVSGTPSALQKVLMLGTNCQQVQQQQDKPYESLLIHKQKPCLVMGRSWLKW
ncbi:hypothetical protein [Pasteurella multocida]|uniref:hypothetical protein n=1 Tax=Pasteurella multocida TaxID=747 RepID=UPI001D0F8240|nr:hypothetical protein [Pasteurella multocida]